MTHIALRLRRVRTAYLLVLSTLAATIGCAVYENTGVTTADAVDPSDAGAGPEDVAGSSSAGLGGDASGAAGGVMARGGTGGSSSGKGGSFSNAGGNTAGGSGSGTGGRGGTSGNTVGGGGTVGGAGGTSAGAGGTSSGGGGSGGRGGMAGGAGTGGAAGGGTVHQLAVGKSSKASTQQSGHEAEDGNDSDLATRWCATGPSFPQWWRVDLGAVHSLTQLAIRFEHSDRNYSFLIETSTNDSAYVMQKSLTGTGTVQTYDFSAGVSARYVRVTVTSANPLMVNGNGTWASFFDLSVTGI